MTSILSFTPSGPSDTRPMRGLGPAGRRPPPILVATDFSPRAQRAVRRAGLLAQEHGDVELCLLHVVDDKGSADLIRKEKREAHRMLTEQIASVAELRDRRCRPVVVTGSPAERILDTAAAKPASCIVMGAPRRHRLGALLTAGTAERVLRRSRSPVLVVNDEAARGYDRILIPIDTGSASANALRVAVALGIAGARDVTLLHAFAAPARGKMSFAGIDRTAIADYVASEREQAREAVSAFLDETAPGGRPWMLRLQEGGPFEVIAREVEGGRPDLVVLGTHARSGLAKLLLGSVAEEAVRSLDADILVVPPVDRGFEAGLPGRADRWQPADVAAHP